MIVIEYIDTYSSKLNELINGKILSSKKLYKIFKNLSF